MTGESSKTAMTNAAEMMEHFRHHPVDLIIWNGQREDRLEPPGRLLAEMLRQYPKAWHKVPSIDYPGGTPPAWSVYEYRAGLSPAAPLSDTAARLTR